MTPALETEGLTKRFGGVRALDDITVSVARGTVLGIIGPNGAGKSTLLNVITGHLAPSAGRVLLNGRDVTGAAPWRLARAGMARTFQVMRTFEDLTASENVALSAMYTRRITRRAAAAVASQLLDTVGLGSSAGQPARELRIADSRRLELARALAAAPRVLFLDEILAGMSHEELSVVLELLLRLRDDNMTMVIVEHHMRAVQTLCDEVLVLLRGRAVSQGPPCTVFADPSVIEAYLGSHAGVAL